MANVELISSEQILAAKNELDDIGARSCELGLFFLGPGHQALAHSSSIFGFVLF